MSRDERPNPSPPGSHVSDERPRSSRPSTLVDGLLDEDRLTLDEAPDPLVDALWEQVAQDTVERSPTVLDRLRELTTPARVAIAAFTLLGAGAAFLSVIGLRDDLDATGLAWLIGLHVIVLGGSVAGLALALRPRYLPPLNALAWVAVGTLLLLPASMALFPGLLPGMTGPVPPIAHLMCGSGGVLVALPATVVVLLLDRSREPSSWRILLAAGAAGLSAFGVGTWHCPSVDPVHLLVAHAGLGTLLGLVVLAGVRALGWLRRLRD